MPKHWYFYFIFCARRKFVRSSKISVDPAISFSHCEKAVIVVGCVQRIDILAGMQIAKGLRRVGISAASAFGASSFKKGGDEKQ